MAALDGLPDAVRAGVLALVRAIKGDATTSRSRPGGTDDTSICRVHTRPILWGPRRYGKNGNHRDRKRESEYLVYVENVICRGAETLKGGGALYLYHVSKTVKKALTRSVPPGYRRGESVLPAAVLTRPPGFPETFPGRGRLMCVPGPIVGIVEMIWQFSGMLLLLAAALAAPAGARNVDLATVPPRDSVQLTIYNSEDLTLVRETRSLTLKKGINRIQYSWANTLIDPTSVEIRALEQEDQIEVLDTTFPGDKQQHCIWNIESKVEGQVPFRVTYFTSGISWSADYVLIANPAETQMSFDGYVQIYNNSGEEYENAQVRLVVGVVNLVEKIRDLAQRGLTPRRPSISPTRKEKRGAMLYALAEAEGAMAPDAARPAEIVKEGLSEYFIYTIEGRQTIPNSWSKRLISFTAREVEFDILYRVRPHQYGARPIRFFMLVNDEEHKLGTTPLPDGLVRTFRDNGRDGLSFLGQQSVNYVPIKEDIELNVELDDEVVWERKATGVKRSNFTFQHTPPRVVGWDETTSIKEEIRNYKDKAVRVELRHVIPGDIDLDAEGATLHDYRTVQFTFDVPARKTLPWHYDYTQHHGRNAKQNRIHLR